jgi:hypothetical protein
VVVLVHFRLTKGKKVEEYLQQEQTKGSDDQNLLKFEYKRCQEMLIHYDELNWDIGSILAGSNIVALGLSPNFVSNQLLPGISIAGMVSMFLWALWFFRHVALYNFRVDRMQVIEKKIGLRQYLMVHEVEKDRSRRRWLGIVPGHVTALLLAISIATVWYAMVWLA